MPWVEPTFPVAPDREIHRRLVTGAYVTAFAHGELRNVGRPDRWHTGAVHTSEGSLVRASQRLAGLGKYRHLAADPLRVEVPADDQIPWLRGRWLYGGGWMDHFGHFLVETLPTLWPSPERIGPIEGLLFHRGFKKVTRQHAWQRRLIDLAGYAGAPVHVVTDTAIRVEQLVVPGRPVVLDGWAQPEARRAWRRVVLAVEGSRDAPATDLVYLTRTRINDRRRSLGRSPGETAEDDRDRDAFFAARGFEVVAPETLSIDDQVRLVGRARVLAGFSGSQLHLAALARPGTDVIELARPKAPYTGTPMQQVINAALEHRSALIPFDPDLGALARGLDALAREDARSNKIDLVRRAWRKAVRR